MKGNELRRDMMVRPWERMQLVYPASLVLSG
jgi:hypothetical protein